MLPDSKARAERLAAVITSGRAANLARRYGIREGGTLAFNLFDEGGTEPKVGEGRRGMRLGMEPDCDLVVADLAVEVLGTETDWTARAIQFRLMSAFLRPIRPALFFYWKAKVVRGAKSGS